MKAKLTDKVVDRSSEVRSMIDRENELINIRITWLITIQGLLFASLGFSWDKPTGTQLIKVLCFLGIAISIIQLIALIAADIAVARLNDWWKNHKPKDYDGPGVMGLPLMENPIIGYITFSNWIPILFIITWVIVWYINAG